MIDGIVDTHCHMHGETFAADFDDVVERARAAGVAQIALVGVDPYDTERALAAASRAPDLFRVIAGLHPHEAGKWSTAIADRLRDLIGSNRNTICAVGEMGLDYHYDFAPKDAQFEAFHGQMELAREVELPIVIHCREAYDDCMSVLRNFYVTTGDTTSDRSQPRGVLHCYFGNLEQAREAVKLGFMLGVGGSCTFKNATDVHQVIQEIALEHLVLETDAPYMSPVPYRGKRNESGYLTHVATRIAELRGIDAATVIHSTTENARRLYRF